MSDGAFCHYCQKRDCVCREGKMICCGDEWSTRFCPNCGKKLITDPILEVLSALRKLQRSAETRFKNGGHQSWRESAAKYQRQIDAIEDLITKAKQGG